MTVPATTAREHARRASELLGDVDRLSAQVEQRADRMMTGALHTQRDMAQLQAANAQMAFMVGLAQAHADTAASIALTSLASAHGSALGRLWQPDGGAEGGGDG
jgi:hypothetical protein